MKAILILSLAAGLLSVGTPRLLAQVATNTPDATVTQKPGAQQRQQNRRRLLKILDLSPKDLKGMTPQDRRAKIKDATDQKVSLLQQKKADGTITPDEQSDLAFLESMHHHGKGKSAGDN